ncbi:MAG: hypothetical protein CMK59_11605 [Proteobacteria bacterium]|nr:hypothetical protein [Pseudomonadota bacterium]
MIHLLLTIFIVFFYSCDGDDPILDKASTMETVVVEKENKSQEKNISKKTETSDKEIEKLVATEKVTIEKAPIRNEQYEKMIVISGKIIVENWSGKSIRIDIFDGNQQALKGPRPSVVKVEYQDKPGLFSVSVPSSQTPLWIGAYIDEDEDGKPGPKDPFGWYEQNPISSDKDTNGIQLVLNTPKHLEK